ncbi:prepilin-type N-terminal cleavage/methylation domain-containing protein [Serratia rubidaea]|uniref:Tfp pilus assembly protein PilV n=1 Tax=Serratia rubidaea TaxID=61652 RepID=A0A3S4Y0B6_SERRU|nr:prepilin-type N-terminal cleavage/methylation domain-containing protein [Serratia rubidaea]MDC6117767.1 prepilin-type N-terminal cleavage/methylation domain-containing protein [Serratia rubidaea]MEB7585857.1 prepilin-type N-terminal cleavage/methylation domain-containing protein [Serratia rubidaea]VEI66277.1 Tfp pilus assembly protein PilV [Serratia rubidaea]
MRTNGIGGAARRQQGFSLPEVLIAALLFSVSLLGLLQYHQVLLQGLQRQWQYRQAWSLAHQQLERLAAGSDVDDVLASGWRRELQHGEVDGVCRQLTVTITTPLRQQARLSRWYCGDD